MTAESTVSDENDQPADAAKAVSPQAVQPREVFLKHPANFLALGAGSGLAPVAPGTFGTVAAVPLVWFFPQTLAAYTLLVIVLFVAGVWFCEHCTKDLGVHDHGAIVFDEWVGYFIAMIAVPRTLSTLVIAFILFRIFDILKPWPIRNIDAKVHGGFGIMIDDVVAGLMACTIVHALINLGWMPGVH